MAAVVLDRGLAEMLRKERATAGTRSENTPRIATCIGWADQTSRRKFISDGDRTRDKMAFYAKVGTRELLNLDRDPLSLELLRFKRVRESADHQGNTFVGR